MFHNDTCVPKNCKLNIFLFLFILAFPLIRIMYIKMLHMFQKLSLFIRRRQGILGNTKAYIQDTYDIDILFSLQSFLQANVICSYLIYVTAKHARFRIHFCHKWSIQAKVLLSPYRLIGEPMSS